MITQLLNSNDKNAVKIAGNILKSGGLVGIPTETVYGLAANALDATAVSKIFEAKGRPQDNPLIVHISNFSQIHHLVKIIPENAKLLAREFWPGPLTMIFTKSDLIPNEVSAGLPTVAIRFPSHPVAQAVIAAAGVPLAAPSANLSGQPSPTSAMHVMHDMDGRIDAVLDGGICEVGLESTVISLAVRPPRLLRPGGITLEQLRAVLGVVQLDSSVTKPMPEGAKVSSPGMKYKHYSPKANVILIKSSYQAYREYVNGHNETGVMALCYDGEERGLLVPAFCYGKEKDCAQQAHLLFDKLRELDENNAVTVYARCPSQAGVGLAVYNRLIRAAGFEVLTL